MKLNTWYTGPRSASFPTFRFAGNLSFLERVAVAMLNWQLKGDKESSEMFVGADCGFCQEVGWHVSTKGVKYLRRQNGGFRPVSVRR
jgi:hypothetical protein